jgi:protein-disulfide isomerase
MIPFLLLVAGVFTYCKGAEPHGSSPATLSAGAALPGANPSPSAPRSASNAELAAPGPATEQGGDTSALKPPKGYKVALVVFEDLQCPDCARAEPLLKDAEKTYKIPLVRHDFPLPQHNWSFDAHVLGRYFDSKSKELGEEWRHFIFSNQNSVTKDNLRGIAERFAADHKTSVPFAVDPTGQFKSEIMADFQLGQRVGVQHTPTIYVVSNSQRGTPFVEVADRSQMFQLIDQMIKQAGGTTESADVSSVKRPTRKPPVKKDAQ